MENNDINYDQVLRLFANNGFELSTEGPDKKFIYDDGDGFKLEFAIPWDLNERRVYNLAETRKVLTGLVNNVKVEREKFEKMKDKDFVDSISKALTDYGMEDLGDDNYAYKEGDTYLFGVDLDYLVTLLVINKDETVKSLLDQMKADIQKVDENGKKTQD